MRCGTPSVIVVGAGPAGAVTAVALARAGVTVTVIEQHRFPRDKVCGECVSATGIDVLRRLDLHRIVADLDPVELTRSLLHPMSAPAIELPLPRTMWGISRSAMDSALLAAAAGAGATVYQPARCESVTPGRRPSVTFRPARGSATETISADWILLADGKGALLPAPPRATGDLGIKTHFYAVDGPRDAIELFAGDGAYGGLAAVERGRWNAAFSVPAAVVRQNRGNLQAVFDRIVDDNRALASRLRRAVRAGPWLASPLPRFAAARSWPDHVIPLGNAAAALEPVGGEGMGLAVRSGELAATALLQHLATGNGRPVAELPAAFDVLWRRRRLVCRSIARLFTSEYADLVSPLLSTNLALPAAVMRWAGKAE